MSLSPGTANPSLRTCWEATLPHFTRMCYLSTFCPKYGVGASDVLQGSYPPSPPSVFPFEPPRCRPPRGTSLFPAEAPPGAVPARSYLSASRRSPRRRPALRYGSRRPSRSHAPTAVLSSPRAASALPLRSRRCSLRPPFAPLPWRHPRPHRHHPSPAQRSARGSRPSKPLLCFLPHPSPAPAPARPPASGTHQRLQRPLSRPGCSALAPPWPKAASWIWSLEATCRSKLLISFPQQSNCTTQAKSTLPPCCS